MPSRCEHCPEPAQGHGREIGWTQSVAILAQVICFTLIQLEAIASAAALIMSPKAKGTAKRSVPHTIPLPEPLPVATTIVARALQTWLLSTDITVYTLSATTFAYTAILLSC